MASGKLCSDMNKLSYLFKPLAWKITDLIHLHNLPMRVYETVRSEKRQLELYSKGASKTLNSRHLLGESIDVVCYIDGKWSWDIKHHHYYEFLGALVLAQMGDKVTWGGSWSWRDLVHYQLK